MSAPIDVDVLNSPPHCISTLLGVVVQSNGDHDAAAIRHLLYGIGQATPHLVTDS